VPAATIVAAIEQASVEEQLVVNMNSQVFASSGIQRELTVDREANYFARVETRRVLRVPLTVQYIVDSPQGIFSTPALDYDHTLDAADLGWFQQQGEVVIDPDTGETSQLASQAGPWTFKDQEQFDEIFAMMTRIVERAPEVELDQGTFAFELDNATALRAIWDLLDDSRADDLSIAGRAAVTGTIDSEGRLTSFRLAMADAVVEEGAGLAGILLVASDAVADVSVGFDPPGDTEALVAAPPGTGRIGTDHFVTYRLTEPEYVAGQCYLGATATTRREQVPCQASHGLQVLDVYESSNADSCAEGDVNCGGDPDGDRCEQRLVDRSGLSSSEITLELNTVGLDDGRTACIVEGLFEGDIGDASVAIGSESADLASDGSVPQVGACLAQLGGVYSPGQPVIACDRLHFNEIVAVVDLSDRSWSEGFTLANGNPHLALCQKLGLEYLGLPYLADQGLEVAQDLVEIDAHFAWSAELWQSGFQQLVCIATSGSPLYEPLAGMFENAEPQR